MEPEYTKKNKKRHEGIVRQAELMSVNRQVNYGYRGTTPNYCFDLPKEQVERYGKYK